MLPGCVGRRSVGWVTSSASRTGDPTRRGLVRVRVRVGIRVGDRVGVRVKVRISEA